MRPISQGHLVQKRLKNCGYHDGAMEALECLDKAYNRSIGAGNHITDDEFMKMAISPGIKALLTKKIKCFKKAEAKGHI